MSKIQRGNVLFPEKQKRGRWNDETNPSQQIKTFSLRIDNPTLFSGWNFPRDRLKLLAALHINFSGCLQISYQATAFLERIGDLESLTALHLDFSGSLQITDQALTFLHELKHLKSLVILSLNFEACDQITDQGIKFLQHIEYLKSLTILDLNFRKCHEMTVDALEFLRQIGYPESLTALFLNFDSCKQITDQDFNHFSTNFFHIKILRTPFLRFSSDELKTQKERNTLKNDISHREFLAFEFPNQTGRSASNLRSDTYFGFPAENPLDISILCQDNFFPHVRASCLINDADELGVYFCHLKDLDILGDLRTLHLRFCADATTDFHLEVLAAQLVKLRSPLRSLHINFKGCAEITEKGLESFLNRGLPLLLYLEDLYLNFDGCFQTGNQDLRFDWWEQFYHLEKLHSLYLSFNDCNKISDDGLKILEKEGIRSMLNLRDLFLSIPNTSIYEPERSFNLLELQSCAIIVKNAITEIQTENFNLKRSHTESQKIYDDKITANIVCFKKKTYSLQNKIYFMNEETLKDLGFDEDLIQKERKAFHKNQEPLQFTLVRSEAIIDILSKRILWKGVNMSETLHSLNLSFYRCLDFTDENLSLLACQGVQHLKSLKTLKLVFKRCYSITDRGLQYLCCEGVCHLTSLNVLELVFDECKKITDEGLKSVFHSKAQYFKGLTSLHLSFCGCNKITDEGLKNLCFEGIQHLKALETFYLNFNWCQKLTDEGLEVLCYHGIQRMTSLIALELNFDGDENITDKGLEILGSHGIQKLQSLKTLKLSFLGCGQITIQGLENLNCEGILYLNSLMTLSLNFDWCLKIKISDLDSFAFQISQQIDLRNSYKISSRRIDLSCLDTASPCEVGSGFSDICVAFVDTLCFALAESPSVVENSLAGLLNQGKNAVEQSLQRKNFSKSERQEMFNCMIFKFEDPNNIFENDLDEWSFGEGVMLDKFETCHYIFDGCSNLTGKGEGFADFCHQGIRNFRSLTTLYLSFNDCLEMTDKGISTLFCEGIDHLKLLEVLSLSFHGSNKITDRAIQDLCRENLQNFRTLKALDLNFNVCDGISDETLQILCCETLKKLDALTSFQFILKNGGQITEKGLKSLISEGMPRLLKLENIQLSFPKPEKASPNVYQAFIRILLYYGFKLSQ